MQTRQVRGSNGPLSVGMQARLVPGFIGPLSVGMQARLVPGFNNGPLSVGMQARLVPGFNGPLSVGMQLGWSEVSDGAIQVLIQRMMSVSGHPRVYHHQPGAGGHQHPPISLD